VGDYPRPYVSNADGFVRPLAGVTAEACWRVIGVQAARILCSPRRREGNHAEVGGFRHARAPDPTCRRLKTRQHRADKMSKILFDKHFRRLINKTHLAKMADWGLARGLPAWGLR